MLPNNIYSVVHMRGNSAGEQAFTEHLACILNTEQSTTSTHNFQFCL